MTVNRIEKQKYDIIFKKETCIFAPKLKKTPYEASRFLETSHLFRCPFYLIIRTFNESYRNQEPRPD